MLKLLHSGNEMGSTTEMIFQVNTQCANSGYLTCCSLTPRQADIYGIFLQRKDIYVIFASRQGTFCSFIFSFLFRRNDISGGPCRGASIGVSPPRRAHSFKKKIENDYVYSLFRAQPAASSTKTCALTASSFPSEVRSA